MMGQLPRAAAPLAAVLALLSFGASSASADAVSKTNSTPIQVADLDASLPAPASPYPSGITVNGADGVISGVKVELHDISHGDAGDMDVQLVGPNDVHITLMSDHASGFAATGVDLAFSDSAAEGLPAQSALVSGTFKPSNQGASDYFPASPGTVTRHRLLEAYEDQSPNGTWRLYAVDDGDGDGGQIAGGWTLTLNLGPATAGPGVVFADSETAPNAGSPYPSPLSVSGVEGKITKAVVRLNDLKHDDPGDMDIMLESPGGDRTTLLSDAGGVHNRSGGTLRIDDEAPGQAHEVSTLSALSYKPTNYQGSDNFPAPAPAQTGSASLGVFNGEDPNGTWKLWTSDDGVGAGGSLSSWELILTVQSGLSFAEAGSSVSESAGTKTIVVKRPEGGLPASVPYSVGTPEDAYDLIPRKNETLHFATGEKSKSITVNVVSDTGHEPDEPFSVQLGAPSGDATILPGSQTQHGLTIQDDDPRAIAGDFNGDGFADQAIGIPGQAIGGKGGAGAVSVIYGAPGGLNATGNQRFSQDTPDVPEIAEAGDGFGTAVASSDFNGDGYSDLAIGAPGEKLGGLAATGHVTVLYGSAAGLTAAGSTGLSQNSPGLPNPNQPGDRFGAALAAGNLGKGWRGDLAIGHPGEDVDPVTGAGAAVEGAGAVTVVFGSVEGLAPTGAHFWHQDIASIYDVAEAGDGFGSVLAVGNLGRSADGELVVGVPNENDAAGAVQVLYSRETYGPSAWNDQRWSQDFAGIEDSSEAGDRFGFSLAVGRLPRHSGNGLAIGVPGEDVGAAADAGAVAMLESKFSGLTSIGDRRIDQDKPGVEDVAEAGDRFGVAVALGELGQNAMLTDFAVGAPGEDVGGKVDAGAVQVFMSGSTAAEDTDLLWHQDSPGVQDTGEAGDQWGSTLTAARFGGGSQEALAIGAPLENVSTAVDAGAMAVLAPTEDGPSGIGDQSWRQGYGGLADPSETNDGFGSALLP